MPSWWRPGDGLDCLTLNVWSPDLGVAGLPVMVWLYDFAWRGPVSGASHGIDVPFTFGIGDSRFDLEHRRTRIWDTTPVDAAYPLADSYRIWERAAPRT